jgi:hypothetical protein
MGGPNTALRLKTDEWLTPKTPNLGEIPLLNPNARVPAALLTGAWRGLKAGVNQYLPNVTQAYPEIAKVLTAPAPQSYTYANALSDALRKRGQNAAFGNGLGSKAALVSALAGQNALTNFYNPQPVVQQPK